MPTTTAPTATISFEVGAKYEARSACNSDCVWSFEVLKRTAKFITVEVYGEKDIRCGVRTWDGVEYASPFGTFSMSPSIAADRVAS